VKNGNKKPAKKEKVLAGGGIVKSLFLYERKSLGKKKIRCFNFSFSFVNVSLSFSQKRKRKVLAGGGI
jgi:hypothetical protein